MNDQVTAFWSVLLVAGLLGACATRAAAVRDHGGYFTAERIANLRANCDKYDWARAARDTAAQSADFWAKMSDEELWRLIPGQRLPRGIDVSFYKGKRTYCLKCGEGVSKFGNYPYKPNHWSKPWKLECPNCHVIFPTNDFGKYYQSGLDETGVFSPNKADRSLLYNSEHPDPNDPLHKYGVDDGYGFFDENGHRHLFIAYCTWVLWNDICSGVSALANAYLYTGDQRYAHKALLMLDRLADLYPDYDYLPYGRDLGYFHSHGGGGDGKIGGCIWETGVIEGFAKAIDKALPGTRDDAELYQFLAEKAKQYHLPRPKGTRELLVQNLDDNLLREGVKALFTGKAAGNEGMDQSAVAACAIALDTDPDTGQWLDWLFDVKGGHIPSVIVGGIDRDGVGAEAAPGYALSWGANIGQTADMLADYGKYTRHDVYRDFPSFKATFAAGWRIALLGYATPNIGDAGGCGTLGIVNGSPSFIVRGYKYLRDPQIGLAAHAAAEGQIAGLGRDIFSPDPDRIEKEIAALAKAAGDAGDPWAGGRNLAGYGLASLEFGQGKPGIGLWMYYGRNDGHGHKDRLNFDIYYKGLCLMPDHGYPEFTGYWPQRAYVTDNTLSHNCVVVNGVPQQANWVGQPELFSQFEDFGAVRVDSREMYGGVSKYQRTLALVKVGEGEAYALDVFRVTGGSDHLYSLHGLPGEVTTTGLNLTRQADGTYAGPDVPYGLETPAGPGYGYSWVNNVERDPRPPAAFTVDWKAEAGYRGVKPGDDIHVRYHSLSELADVALGDMQPPQNKTGNPKWLRHVLAHRIGSDLSSVFAGIVEPYSATPHIVTTERLALDGGAVGSGAVAVKVTLADGAVDYLMASDDDTALVRAAEGLEFAGGVGWLRVRDGQVERASLCRGTRLALGNFSVQSEAPGHVGRIVRMDKDMEGKGHVWVDAPLPVGDVLRGQQMIIENDRVRNACYEIEGVERDGDLWKVCLGEVSFIRGFQDPQDYTKGYVYDFQEGAGFIIPLAVWAARTGEGTYRLRANMKVELTVPG